MMTQESFLVCNNEIETQTNRPAPILDIKAFLSTIRSDSFLKILISGAGPANV